ncbi:unnamed protein product [Staurois parvus]|uniref:G-protein coupled receptors family 1 profile domain-containing protein n=1 Tax=Staurois parvus TaxID=386267 RepID=A0ABN9HNQ1_9NEOB|nr:unnamed protein product [Staurois parvus]
MLIVIIIIVTLFFFPPTIGGALLAYDSNSGTNFTSNSSQGFSFICFPEVHSSDIAAPLTFLLIAAIISNVILLFIIFIEPKLHHPMYYFLAMLAMVDILLCTVTTPRVLLILWTEYKTISESACFSQMFFNTYWSAMESSIFLVMAYDRYVAICNPLHYPTIITNKLVAKACVFIVVRNLVVALPPPVLAARLDYCASRQIRHCFCEKHVCREAFMQRLHRKQHLWVGVLLVVRRNRRFSYHGFLFPHSPHSSESSLLQRCLQSLPHMRFPPYRNMYILLYRGLHDSVQSDTPGAPPSHSCNILYLHSLLPPLLNPLVYGMLTKEIRNSVKKMIGKIKIHP